MKEILFTEFNLLQNCKLENNGAFFTDNSILQFVLCVKDTGYYTLVFDCDFINSDTWHNITVLGNKGEIIEKKIGFPMGHHKTETYLYLYEGENNVKIAGDYGSGYIFSVTCPDNPELLSCRLSPKREMYFKDNPRNLKIHLLHYNSKPTEIIWSGGTLPFIVCQSEADEITQGEKMARSELIVFQNDLSALPLGTHCIQIIMDNGQKLPYMLTIEAQDRKAPFEILNFDVSHGNSTLMFLPNGKHLLIDSGKTETARKVIIPFIKRNKIHIDYFLLTHFHDDHNGMLEEILLQNNICKPDTVITEKLLTADTSKRYGYISQFGYLDNHILRSLDRLDQIWDLGGVEITVLNSCSDEAGCKINNWEDENRSSVSFYAIYNGFRYHHSADNYADVEESIMKQWAAKGKKDTLKCDYFYANHHFHGSVSDEFIRYINPIAVFVSAQAAVYSRAAYTSVYKNRVEMFEYPNKRLQDTLLSCEVGNVRIKVESGDNWGYECIGQLSELHI